MPALLNRFLPTELRAADDSGVRLELPREIEGSHDHVDWSPRSAAYPLLKHVGIKRSRQHERPRGVLTNMIFGVLGLSVKVKKSGRTLSRRKTWSYSRIDSSGR
jgi:hypothetical protein